MWGRLARASGGIALWLAIPFLSLAAERTWPHETSRLEPDPTVVWGTLDNGFRYALLPHTHSPERISMRLVVEVGSLNEEEDERGLAHFVEHMGFEGTTHFEQGQLFSFFQKLGMSFGGDLTAFTSFDHTIYHLELPKNQTSLIEQSLLLYRDFADGILFDSARVEKEREIILREKQARDTPSARIQIEGMAQMFAGTLLPDRSPIGTEEIIRSVTREELIDFYERWYRPDLMTLYVVGDMDLEEMEAMIAARFEGLEKREEAAAETSVGKLAKRKRSELKTLSVEGVDRLQIEASRLWDEGRESDSEKLRRLDFQRQFTTEMINQRCRRAIDGIREDFARYEVFLGYPMAQLKISVDGDAIANGVVWIDRILRQAEMHGFGEKEIEAQKAEWLKVNRNYANRINSLEPQSLIGDLVSAVMGGKVYRSPEQAEAMNEGFIREFGIRDAKRTLKDVWRRKQFNYLVAGSLEGGFSNQWLADLLKADQRYKVPPYIAQDRKEMHFSELGMDGVVVEETEVDEIGAKVFRFSNNTRLTYMKTDFTKGEAHVLVKIGAGMLEFDAKNPASHALAINSMFRSGTPFHNTDELYSFMREELDGFSLGSSDHDAFSFQATAELEGAENFLRIVSEFLLRPEIDPVAFEVARSKSLQGMKMELDGLASGYRILNRLLYPNLPRFHSPTIGEMESARIEDSANWLKSAFLEGYLEVVVVGDFEESRVVDMVSKTLGALPKRKSGKSDFEAGRTLAIDLKSGSKKIEYMAGKGENAMAVVSWTILERGIPERDANALYALCEILENRLHEEVRARLGQSYSPIVDYESYFAYNNFKRIRAEVDCLKEDAPHVLEVVKSIVEGLASSAVTMEEIDRAVAPMEDSIKQAWRDNAFLASNILYGLSEYPVYIERSLALRGGSLRELRPADIQRVARKYLRRDNALSVSIVPSEDGGVSEAFSLEKDGVKRAVVAPE